MKITVFLNFVLTRHGPHDTGPTEKSLIMHPLLAWLAVVGLVHKCNYIYTIQWLASRAADIYKVRILFLKISQKLPTKSANIY